MNRAAEIALEEISKGSGNSHHSQPFVLSIGSTPTAHAAGAESRQILSESLRGKLELHAGKGMRTLLVISWWLSFIKATTQCWTCNNATQP